MGWTNLLSKYLLYRNRHSNPLFYLSPIQLATSHKTLASAFAFNRRNLCSFPVLPSASAIKTGSLQLFDSESTDLSRTVSLISKNGIDMERELEGLCLDLSHGLVIDVIRVLSDRGNSAFRFFKWVSSSRHGFSPDSKVYNVVVGNLFLAEDYEVVICVIKELSFCGYFLTEEAFGFLKMRKLDCRRKDLVVGVLETLERVGGSCLSSGINALMRVLCGLCLFDLARLVEERSVKIMPYYRALIAAKCRNDDFEGAKEMLDQMRRSNCNLVTGLYNYLLGRLFKNGMVAEGCEMLQEMEELGCAPDEVTYEVIIFRACRINNMDVALGFLNRMLAEGLKPRLTTHAGFIKGYFRLGKVVDAHNYVVDMSVRDSCSTNVNYSLLASLFRMSGRVVEAAKVLNEMMEKGLKPNFPIYTRTVKDLRKIGREDTALNLRSKFSAFPSLKCIR